MKSPILFPALFAALALTAPAAVAGNVGGPLSACYEHVAIACEATSRQAQACTATGMSACETVLEGGAPQQATLIRVDFDDPHSHQPVIVFVHTVPTTIPLATARLADASLDPEAIRADG
jgi:hypothetical protein